MKRYIYLFCGFLLLTFGTLASAENVQKLGYINTERVYRESEQAMMISDVLQKEFAARRVHLQEMAQAGVNIEKELANPKISAKQKRRLQADYQQKQREYLLSQQKFTEDYSLRRNEEFTALQYQANQVISQLAKEEGYDLILQDVVYINKKFDITDKVIDILNKKP